MFTLILAVAIAAPPQAPHPPQATDGCPCPFGCRCYEGKPCQCLAPCPCGKDCPGLKAGKRPITYADGYRRVEKGETLQLAVGVKAKAGEVQSPPIPNVKPGVYRWYRGADGTPTCDFILIPGVSPAERNETYKQGDGIPRIRGPFFVPPTNSPFTLPGCLPGKA